MTIELDLDNIRAYARAWLETADLPDVKDEEKQVALILVGYNTPEHRDLMGISEQAQRFAKQHFPNGLD